MTKRFLLFVGFNFSEHKGAETLVGIFDSLEEAKKYAKDKIHRYMVDNKDFEDNVSDRAGTIQHFFDTEGWAHVLDLETKQIIEV